MQYCSVYQVGVFPLLSFVVVHLNLIFSQLVSTATEMLQTDLLKAIDRVTSPMAVSLEGLGFNLCVMPFLNVCVSNLPQSQGWRLVRGCQSWVGGAILEMGERRLSWRRQ